MLLDFLFPKICLGCGDWGAYLCPDCLNFIKPINKPICPQCQKPSFYGKTHSGCYREKGLAGLTSVFKYQGVVKKAINKLKNNFVTDLRETILEMFLSFCSDDKAFVKFIIQKNVFLVPIPLYWQRKNWRGFNQTELLGEMISQKLNIGFCPDLLIRTKNTKTNFKINKNTLNSFSFPKPKIILFDDIWFTGLTLKACTRILKKNGFKKVWGLTLAR